MRRMLALIGAALLAGAAAGQAKRSSRNLEPLTRRPAAAPAAPARDGGGGAAAPAPAAGTEQVAYLGPASGWGFVTATSPYYSPQGKRLGTLPGGTLFRYTEVRKSDRNPMLVSLVRRGEAWEGPFLLDCTDIAGYEGDPEKVDPATVRDLGAYYTLAGRAAARKEELAEQARAACPHFEPARRAQAEYQASVARAAELERAAAALTGPRKSRALEELRAFKYEQVRIKAQADQTAAAYREWKARNPPDPAAWAADAQLRELTRQLEAARAPVAGLVAAPEKAPR